MQRITFGALLTVGACGFLGAIYTGCGNDEDFDDLAKDTPGTCMEEAYAGDCKIVYLCGHDEPVQTINAQDGRTCQSMGITGKCLDGTCQLPCITSTGQVCSCTMDEECPQSECHKVTCKLGKCVVATVGNNTGCTLENTDNSDKVEGFCLNGTCVECTPGNITKCKAGNKPSCDEYKCAYCDNMKQDGGETGIDCGGPLCGRCNGTQCTEHSQCASDHCMDGVCCNMGCGIECYRCNSPGNDLGKCVPVPAGVNDGCPGDGNLTTSSGCNEKQICQTSGGNGQGCNNDSDCLSDYCKMDGLASHCATNPN